MLHDFFFFNDTATTEIYTYLPTLSLHDALPSLSAQMGGRCDGRDRAQAGAARYVDGAGLRRRASGTGSFRQLAQHRLRTRRAGRSEEHTSELQSLMRISYAVFCLKKKNYTLMTTHHLTTYMHHT